VLRLVAEKARRLDQSLQFLAVGVGEGSGIGIAGEQGRGDQIHPHIGTLGRQDGGNEELQRVGVDKGTMSVGVEVPQRADQTGSAGAQGVLLFHAGMLANLFRTRQREWRREPKRWVSLFPFCGWAAMLIFLTNRREASEGAFRWEHDESAGNSG